MVDLRARALGVAKAVVMALALTAGPSLSRAAEPAPGVADAEVKLAPPPTAWYAAKPIGAAEGPVTAAQLAKGADRTHWLTYGGDYRNFRHSPVSSLTPATVKRLHVAWSAPTGTPGQF